MALGEQADRVTQIAVQLPRLQLRRGLHAFLVDEHVHEGQILLDVVGGLVFEGEHDRAEHPVLETMEFALAHAEGVGHLVLGRHPAQLGGQTLLDTLQLAGEVAHRAGGPVGSPHGIENGPADPLGGETLERDPAGLVVATGRLDQTERTGPGQIVTVDVAGEVDGHLEHDVLHEREVLLDHLGEFGFHRPRALGRTHTAPTGSGRSDPLFCVALAHRPGISLGKWDGLQ